ncbi:MAG: rRNA maturation RNase YbeY [Oscillospiraceae bacterium]|nr:rRNA maturation RNase YbeY [Oscillospiraceae bacterium]
MINSKVVISDRQTAVKIPSGTRLFVRKCCNAVLKEESYQHRAEVSVSFIDDKDMRKLNFSFRGIDETTDVLSFPMITDGEHDLNVETGARILGDIVISIERAVSQADLYGHSLMREVGFLTVHSMYHLLGYDHKENTTEAAIMREKEEAILTELGYGAGASIINRND